MNSPAADHRTLQVVMYHYIRDLPNTRFPRINGMLCRDFESQVDLLRQRHEMASLESAIAFLSGDYVPQRDLCLLTFDDGLREHFEVVTPLLAARNIQGVFGLITACLEEHRVVAVHKNHFLMAELNFDEYRQRFSQQMRQQFSEVDTTVDGALASRSYRWDTPNVAAFKYLLNFVLSAAVKEQILDSLFVATFGNEQQFARTLYVQWDEARQMQADGMVLAGHSHCHQALATLTDDQQQADLQTCANLLRTRLNPQHFWPFTYPYGKRQTFNQQTMTNLGSLDFGCAFTTEVGENRPGDDRLIIRRIDPKDVR